jgi:hypothetical protein
MEGDTGWHDASHWEITNATLSGLPKLTLIELPCIVQSDDTALQMIGGVSLKRFAAISGSTLV